jgi:aspartyl-tRNA(Asn)/glutamyl-tRNA(Gln) amidotransferase subunit A
MSYLDLTIADIHQAYLDKKTTPLALTLEAIARAKENDDFAFELITEQVAIEQAQALTDVEVGNLLWGIPFVLKDNFSTKGIVTTAGSDILKGYQPLFDATIYQRLKDKKAILIGKATLDELAMGGTGMTGHLGKQFNPFDPTHSRQIGGSSSGSAAVVAAAIVPFSLGSDTGDSIRKPASYAGLVGFKPTWGRISRYGLFPFAPSLDHVGFFTRSISDASLLLDALSGQDAMDNTSIPERPTTTFTHLDTLPKSKKIAVLKPVMDSIDDQEILSSFYRTVESLKQYGYAIDEIDFDKDLLSAIYPTYMTISCAEATSNNANLDGLKFGPSEPGSTYQEVMMKARTKGFSELIKRRFVIGSFVLMRENQDVLFLRAQKVRRLIVEALGKVYQNYDLIVLPATPTIAPKFNDTSDRLSSQYLIADSHLALGNFAGLPSLTLPIGFKEGMPFGVNIMGRAYEELTTLQCGLTIETMTGLKNLHARKGQL